VPEDLEHAIKDFYNHKFEHEVAAFDVNAMLDELPSSLQRQVRALASQPAPLTMRASPWAVRVIYYASFTMGGAGYIL
jgi:hypothetical protein